MTKPADPYSRVYWRIVDDERFADIYGSDAHLAAWLRLLLGADQAWPASAPIPASCRRGSVEALVTCGLVELRPGGLYRIHGLDAERGRRASHAETAASVRWSSGSAHGTGEHPASTANGMPRRDETRQAETSQDEDPAWLHAWLSVKMRMPTARQREVIDGYLRTFDETGIGRAADIFLRHPDDPLGALIADLREFRAKAAGEAIKVEAEATQRRKVERKGFRPGTVEYELAKMLASEGEK
jgi:hypothetical protein